SRWGGGDGAVIGAPGASVPNVDAVSVGSLPRSARANAFALAGRSDGSNARGAARGASMCGGTVGAAVVTRGAAWVKRSAINARAESAANGNVPETISNSIRARGDSS